METPTDWDGPVLLMNFPLSVSNEIPNNALMSLEQGRYDKSRAGNQWLDVYRVLIDSGALIYVLPGHGNLQDLPFVANLGCYLPHIKDRSVILLSNFTSQPRVGEDAIGRKFFESFNYEVRQSPCCWEGEADLKWVRDNIYVGGTGLRSTVGAFDWMRTEFNMNIIEVEILNSKLYHLDCVFFPLTETKALVNVSVMKPEDVKKLEQYVEIIAVPKDCIYKGWTNCVRVGGEIFYANGNLSPTLLKSLLRRYGFELEVFNLTEFDKSGADLSCLIMHLNAKNRF